MLKIILLFFLFCQIFSNEILVDEIYFIVNNKIITKSDFEKEKNVQQKILANNPNPKEQFKITDELILSNMITFAIIENELSLKQFSVSPEDVTNAIKQIMHKNNIKGIDTFKKVLEKQIPFEQFYQQQKKNLIMQKFMQLAFQKSPIKKEPTAAEISDYYQKNKELFRLREKTYKLSKISLNVPLDAKFSARLKIENKINQIKEEVETKKISFEKAVLKYSEDSNSKLSLGNIGWLLKENPIFNYLQEQLKDYLIHQITKPIFLNNEISIYKITAIKQNGYLDLADVKNKIKVFLQQKYQQENINKEIKLLINSSYISKKTKSFPNLIF